MKIKLIQLILFLALKISLFASHIVGGEFELLHISDFSYRVNAIVYFDLINGTTGAKDEILIVHIFSKSINQLIQSVTLPLTNENKLAYTNPSCNSDENKNATQKIIYSSIIELSPDIFNDPVGYYMTWERCCRNYTINNIYSEDPTMNGISAGQTFYLEFPSVMLDGKPFINSSPRLFPALTDYACVDREYYADFRGTDDDGDSLVYKLVTPYSTFDTRSAIPITPNAAPYPEVIWREGFDVNYSVPGTPSLNISNDGILTVTPKASGLYAFAIEVEEFRNDVKIGSMRRDFQILVVGDCFAYGNPQVFGRKKNVKKLYDEGETIYFDFDDDDKCIEILLTDQIKDVGTAWTSNLNIRTVPIGFKASLEDVVITPTESIPISSILDTARYSICLPKCSFTRSGQYKIGVIGYNDACPQPSLDTLVLNINIPQPINQKPYFKINGVNRSNQFNLSDVYVEGKSQNVLISTLDDDLDLVDLEIYPVGFEFDEVGMTLENVITTQGETTTKLIWNYNCELGELDFSKGRDITIGNIRRKAFDIQLKSDDMDVCNRIDFQTFTFSLSIDFENYTEPKIYEAKNPDLSYIEFFYKYNQLISLDIIGNDNDNDLISIFGKGLNYNFSELGIVFDNVSGFGKEGLSNTFTYQISCPYEFDLDTLKTEFSIIDYSQCKLSNTKYLNIDFILSSPKNSSPKIEISSKNDIKVYKNDDYDSISLKIGQEINLSITAIENEGKNLSINLIKEGNAPKYGFSPSTGKGLVRSDFQWKPQCQDLDSKVLLFDDMISFISKNDDCHNQKSSTKQLLIHVQDDKAEGTEFLPPNFFTPNGDNKNDYFGMFKRNEFNNELENILPIDNCAGKFDYIIILNRWGREVFTSNNRDFKWYGDDNSAGIYYYLIVYSNKKFRGTVNLVY